ncbi:hypothetical protein ASG11_10560 [Sphingomonas sp. Leaf357]|uniref:MAPEG family protein n=1 Tax=Sphingomonas sp. Leaf357 TaxID=1736350 RepID=UPI0006F7477E|nr:MAPEG family protein [Sphingomonas sp. Leaf357]KQS04637.1 hypothetical protein ASG11_10560 [Sphingomonas sp. Leaf357]
MTTELTILGLSVLLLVVHIGIQGQTVTKERGRAWNASARDEQQRPLGVVAGRAQRALDNYKETWPAFIALALALAVSGQSGGIGAIGACVWFAARIVYVPLYLLGVVGWRSVAFLVSLLGLGMMLVRLF